MKLLLHICCAPCAIMCVQTLREEGIEPVGFWENPNIHPFTEYRSRRSTLEEYARSVKLEMIFHGDYGLRTFVKTVAADIDRRCVECYRMRFRKTAQYAAEHGFTHFSSTLFISPYQNHALMKKVAEEAAEEYGVEFLYRDFRPWFKEGQERAREMGLYMQKYCGCVFSEEDRYNRKAKDPMTEEGIRAGLQTRWAGRGVLCCETEMDSTNTRAKELARDGAPHGSVAVCDKQTAGRGRMQRIWETPEGLALTQSMVLRPTLAPEQVQLITFAAAVASAKAIEELCPGLKPGIKWPNDIVISGKKCAGILCEMAMDGGTLAYVIPGVGINVNQTMFPPDLRSKATSLLIECRRKNAAHPFISREKLLCAYLRHMEDAVDALEENGMDGIAQESLTRSVTLNSQVRVSGTEYDFVGTAKAIDETGALIVTDEQGTDRRVLCGDVSVRGLMGYV